MEVQREEYGAVEVESVLTVGPSSQRMTVECVAFNLVGVSRDTLAMEVSGEDLNCNHSFPPCLLQHLRINIYCPLI